MRGMRGMSGMRGRRGRPGNKGPKRKFIKKSGMEKRSSLLH